MATNYDAVAFWTYTFTWITVLYTTIYVPTFKSSDPVLPKLLKKHGWDDQNGDHGDFCHPPVYGYTVSDKKISPKLQVHGCV